MRRLLVTTALEETWGDDEPVLFLGEWCRRYERRDRWSIMGAEVAPYHWDDRVQLYADYRYLRGLHERLLMELAERLNAIHSVDRSVRYWRILVGPWLGYFVQMLFDRWISIHQAVREFGVEETIVLTGAENDAVPRNMADFIRLFLGDEWNHDLYATILREFTHVRCVARVRRDGTASAPAVAPNGSRKQRLKRFVASSFSRIASVMTRDDDAFLMGTYLPVGHEVRLNRRLGQVPQFWRTVSPIDAGVDPAQRGWTLAGDSASEFERAARALVGRHIPTAYLEGYAPLILQTVQLPWPTSPRFIWTSNAHNADDVFKAWTAERVERGAPLVIGQHGGHFGLGLWSFAEEHDVAISDRYLSWGWSDSTQPKVLPLGQLKAKHPLGVRHAQQPQCLLVTCTFPHYSYWMSSVLVAGQYLEYLEDQYAFVEALPRRIRAQLVVRLYAALSSWSPELRWRDRFPDLQLDDGRAPIDKLIQTSRVYISTYNATTFLESFTMDVPTVIFWNPAHWELRDGAVPFFDELRAVGIFHETPASAAAHVAAIWDDVDAWWTSPAVMAAVARFTAQYSSLPDRLLDRVEATLRDVMSDAEPTRGGDSDRS